MWREQIVSPGIPFSARFYAPDYYGSAQYVQFFGMLPDTYWEPQNAKRPGQGPGRKTSVRKNSSSRHSPARATR